MYLFTLFISVSLLHSLYEFNSCISYQYSSSLIIYRIFDLSTQRYAELKALYEKCNLNSDTLNISWNSGIMKMRATTNCKCTPFQQEIKRVNAVKIRMFCKLKHVLLRFYKTITNTFKKLYKI